MTFVLVPQPTLDNKHRRSFLTSGRSVSGWRLVTHGARALQPNGFRFRLILREVPGLSANPLGFRGGGGTAIQERETEGLRAYGISHHAGLVRGYTELLSHQFFSHQYQVVPPFIIFFFPSHVEGIFFLCFPGSEVRPWPCATSPPPKI